KQGMDMADLKTLHQFGFELGNHTKDHANPASLSVEENKAQVAYIEDLFKELQVPAPKVYAYPGAPYVEKAATAVKSMGYIAARTGGNRPLDLTALNPFDMPSYLLCDDHPECFDKAFVALKEGKTVILTYHGIPDVEHPWCNVSVEHFTEHMQRLADIGCKCPTYSELMKQCQ
ncbi:MAG: polysaccharide deacetylase family protein, partial [Victivallales bacterium]|nr:polysaccharide deacetylase family protein [Victivallales bacterium]